METEEVMSTMEAYELAEQVPALRSEIKRLRKALQTVAEMTAGGSNWRAEETALAALAGIN
jgi:hypothetical protein